jgi:FkbM family methyltransferase
MLHLIRDRAGWYSGVISGRQRCMTLGMAQAQWKPQPKVRHRIYGSGCSGLRQAADRGSMPGKHVREIGSYLEASRIRSGGVRSEGFWSYFDVQARPRLALRADTFAKIFEYLDRFDRPVGIVETGCVRKADNWAGDGQSTILFDKYAEFHPGTVVYTVDIDEQATTVCRTLVSARVKIHTSDSIAFLKALADTPPNDLASVDLLYLDSIDLNLDDVFPSAFHHMKELTAVAAMIRPETLVVVDDSPSYFSAVIDKAAVKLVTQPKIGGMGKLIAEFAQRVGAESCFVGYQCGWTGLTGRRQAAVGGSNFVRGVITGGSQGLYAVNVEDQFVGKELRETGEYGAAEVAGAASFLTKEDNALVVGSHVGTIAISLARHCRHVTAIEANPWTFKLLQCNIILNNVGNIDAIQLAANDKTEMLKFVMNTQNSGGSKRLPVVQDPIYFHDNPAIVEVEADSLDVRLAGREYALVFMDIEGSEYFALKGMQNILRSARTLIVEFLPHHLSKVAGVTPEQFVEPILPHFNKLFVPGLNRRSEQHEFASTLRFMYAADHGETGLIFTK